ncbi:MAG: DUF3987 domain-containing protein [wastewater metagenome]|nr:DUF3987 domain-containing protein [Candidatus Loosdrechtia aerotolerans]
MTWNRNSTSGGRLPGMRHKGINLGDPLLGLSQEEAARLLDDYGTKATPTQQGPREDLLSTKEYPLHVFPEQLRDLIKSFAHSFTVSEEVVGTVAATILSSSIGNSIEVCVKNDYAVRPFLWAVLIMPSGSTKSPLINKLSGPVKQMQGVKFFEYTEKMKEYDRLVDVYKSSQKGKRNFLENPAEKPEMPTLAHFYVSDITLESLMDVFESQQRGVLSYQDELSGLIKGLDQYKKSGNDRQRYLEIFNCAPMKIDRKGRQRFVPNTGIGIIGGIQPEILPSVFGSESFSDGLLPRFIFCYPEVYPKTWVKESVPESLISYWEYLVSWCYEIPVNYNAYGGLVPQKLIFSTEGMNVWEDFYNRYSSLEVKLSSKKGSVFIPKLHLYCAKFAGVLHVLNSLESGHIPPVINEKSVRGAVDLADYYLGQVGKLLRLYGSDDCDDCDASEHDIRVINVIYNLRNEVKKGRLNINSIVEEYNNNIDSQLHLDNKIISNIISKNLNLSTIHSNAGSLLLWESNKLQNLFLKHVPSLSSLSSLSSQNGDKV